MSLPEPVLDDLRFQRDLVDEARRWVARRCPELTNFNLSNPLATLIELQAWNTELLAYRVNQIPEKIYIRLLNMLGETLASPEPAHSELTFYLSAPFPVDPDALQKDQVVIEAGIEVATMRADEQTEVIFSTDQRREIRSAEIVAVFRGDEASTNYWRREKTFASQSKLHTPMKAFGQLEAKPNNSPDSTTETSEDRTLRPRDRSKSYGIDTGDVFYIGLDDAVDLRGYVLLLEFDCVEAAGAGIRRNDPPWEWQCYCRTANGFDFEPISLGRQPGEIDTTGGLNNSRGSLVVYLPQNVVPVANPTGLNAAIPAFWLRCEYVKRGDQQGYRQSPYINNIRASVLGISVPATHARTVYDEFLGVSTGDPGQTFKLLHGPLLPDADLEIEEIRSTHRPDSQRTNSPMIWKSQSGFAHSGEHDRHFVADARAGEVAFGPLVMQRDGSTKQYGRVPAPGSELRLVRYRYGGGKEGNVPADVLRELRQSVAYVAYVTNWLPASGGQEQEDVLEAQMRLRREMWAQRAVTADDIEVLARNTPMPIALPAILRAKAWPGTQGEVKVLAIPKPIIFADNRVQLNSLNLSEVAHKQVQAHLDAHRLLTVKIDVVRKPKLVGVRVSARVSVAQRHNSTQVIDDVKWLLRAWLAPVDLLPPEEPDNALNGARTSDTPRHALARRFLAQFIHPEFAEPWRAEALWQGWPFNRTPKPSDAEMLIRQVSGVSDVRDVTLFVADLPFATGASLLPLNANFDPDVLVCSFDAPELDHDITLVPNTGGTGI